MVARSLPGSTESDPTVDAIVAATAIGRRGGVIATVDPDDLTILTAGHPDVRHLT